MNYFLKELLEKQTGYYLEVSILLIVGVLLVLSILMLTIVKKLKDK